MTAAGAVHAGQTAYQVPPGAPPRERYEVALRLLAAGQPTRARHLLDEVVREIDDSGEVWFHWLLAFLSRRSVLELSAGERARLGEAFGETSTLPPGRWTPAIEMIRRLVTAAEPDDLAARFAALRPGPQAAILRHLERVLEGPVKDELWPHGVKRAETDQAAGRRADRAWKFFEPDPANPRTRPVRPAGVPAWRKAVTGLAATFFGWAAGTVGWLALTGGGTVALVACLVAGGGGCVALSSGAEWRFRAGRLRARERELRAGYAPSTGFAAEVDRLYARYSAMVAPRGPARESWLVETAGLRRTLRDETVEVYREARVSAAEIRWLIRYQIRELRAEWADGGLRDYATRWAPPPVLRSGTVGGAVAAAAGGVWAVQAALRVDGLTTAGAVLPAVLAGWIAATGWLRLAAERRRVAADLRDQDRRMTAYWFEWQRWRHKLSDRPGDDEMATWLDCDRRLLIDQALRAHNLTWGDVSAYASLEAPGRGSRKARWLNGPWRYSGYELLVFLLTADGVRQVTVALDFGAAAFHTWRRDDYGYDAVAAVRVVERGDGGHEFRLSRADGHELEVPVTEPGPPAEGEDAGALRQGALDATGLRTLLVLLDGAGCWNGPAYRRAC